MVEEGKKLVLEMSPEEQGQFLEWFWTYMKEQAERRGRE